MDAEPAERGREGHFGLPGMRDRAARIAAQLKIESAAAAGTLVEPSFPAALFTAMPLRVGRLYATEFDRCLENSVGTEPRQILTPGSFGAAGLLPRSARLSLIARPTPGPESPGHRARTAPLPLR
jgi:hypothetical protein